MTKPIAIRITYPDKSCSSCHRIMRIDEWASVQGEEWTCGNCQGEEHQCQN